MTEVSLCKAHSSTLYRAKKKHFRTTAPSIIMQDQAPPSPVDSNHSVGSGRLASKVREIRYQPPPPPPPPSEFIVTTSTSTKRKRTTTIPSSSISTPLFNHSQLPPLHLRTPSLASLSSNLQNQLSFTNMAQPFVQHYSKVIETVSLKSSPSISKQQEDCYYVKNLAITDSYTFRDLLSEIDFAGTPPPGKRIVISDDKRERIFPLNQPIRSVIRYPKTTHAEFYLGITEKPSIDWNNFI